MVLVAPVLSLAVAGSALRAQHPLLTLPLDDPAYAQLNALDNSGCRAGRVSAFRPYFVADVRASLADAAGDPACAALLVDALQRRFLGAADTPAMADSLAGARGLTAGGALTVRATALGRDEFRPLWRDVRPSDEGDPAAVAIARGRVRWSPNARFLALSEAYVQSSRQNDPTVRTKSLRQSSGFLDIGNAYLNGQLGPVKISFGRASEAWLGSGRESLVLSAHGPMLDRLMVSGRWNRVQARMIVASINDVIVGPGDSLAPEVGNVRFHRALIGHAITWLPVDALELTVGETMLFSRRGAPLDLAYLNPAAPFIVAQNDLSRTGAESRDNLGVFGALRARLGQALLSGEILVDDIQVDAADRERTADQLAYALRGAVPLPLARPTIATLEYRRIWAFTYSRPLYSEVYQNYDAPLGSELGPDADMLSGELEHWPNGMLRLAAGVSLWRHGATRLERRPSESPNGQADRSYPSTRPERPVVQNGLVWNAQLGILAHPFPVTARVEMARLSNLNNQPGPAALYLRAQVTGTYEFNYP